jgi:hypothetical protein
MIRGFAKCEALSDLDALALVEFELPGGTDHIVTQELVKSTRNNEESLIERAELCFSGMLVNNILGFVPNRSVSGGWCGAGAGQHPCYGTGSWVPNIELGL